MSAGNYCGSLAYSLSSSSASSVSAVFGDYLTPLQKQTLSPQELYDKYEQWRRLTDEYPQLKFSTPTPIKKSFIDALRDEIKEWCGGILER